MATEGSTEGPALISVVMPVLDEEEHVGEQLAALASQTYEGPWELVVADNGSSDRTIEIVHRWADRLPALRVADASGRRGLNYARNVGASAARGDLLLFCDADNVADRNWVAALAAAAHAGDLITGVHDLEALNDPTTRAWCPWNLARDLRPHLNFLPYARGGNCAVWASTAREVRWNEAFAFGSSDVEFSWRAQLSSRRLVLAQDALMHRRLRSTMRSMARQYYRYGHSVPLLYREFLPASMPGPDRQDAWEGWSWLIRRLPDLWRGPESRGRWVRIAAMRWGRLVGSARFRYFAP